jgi:GTP-binding protein
MGLFSQAAFYTTVNHLKDLPQHGGREVAFVGRSNAGKSSAINVLVNRRQLARTSKTPGRTRLVNFFGLREGQRLVDLPGYGYARVPEEQREHWGRLLQRYFETRQSLRGLILVVDVRRQLTGFDRQMLGFSSFVNLPAHILLTKADKLKRGQASRALAEVTGEAGPTASVQLFSATSRQGLDEARQVLERFLRLPPEADTFQPTEK